MTCSKEESVLTLPEEREVARASKQRNDNEWHEDREDVKIPRMYPYIIRIQEKVQKSLAIAEKKDTHSYFTTSQQNHV